MPPVYLQTRDKATALPTVTPYPGGPFFGQPVYTPPADFIFSPTPTIYDNIDGVMGRHQHTLPIISNTVVGDFTSLNLPRTSTSHLMVGPSYEQFWVYTPLLQKAIAISNGRKCTLDGLNELTTALNFWASRNVIFSDVAHTAEQSRAAAYAALFGLTALNAKYAFMVEARQREVAALSGSMIQVHNPAPDNILAMGIMFTVALIGVCLFGSFIFPWPVVWYGAAVYLFLAMLPFGIFDEFRNALSTMLKGPILLCGYCLSSCCRRQVTIEWFPSNPSVAPPPQIDVRFGAGAPRAPPPVNPLPVQSVTEPPLERSPEMATASTYAEQVAIVRPDNHGMFYTRRGIRLHMSMLQYYTAAQCDTFDPLDDDTARSIHNINKVFVGSHSAPVPNHVAPAVVQPPIEPAPVASAPPAPSAPLKSALKTVVFDEEKDSHEPALLDDDGGDFDEFEFADPGTATFMTAIHAGYPVYMPTSKTVYEVATVPEWNRWRDGHRPAHHALKSYVPPKNIEYYEDGHLVSSVVCPDDSFNSVLKEAKPKDHDAWHWFAINRTMFEKQSILKDPGAPLQALPGVPISVKHLSVNPLLVHLGVGVDLHLMRDRLIAGARGPPGTVIKREKPYDGRADKQRAPREVTVWDAIVDDHWARIAAGNPTGRFTHPPEPHGNWDPVWFSDPFGKRNVRDAAYVSANMLDPAYIRPEEQGPVYPLSLFGPANCDFPGIITHKAGKHITSSMFIDAVGTNLLANAGLPPTIWSYGKTGLAFPRIESRRPVGPAPAGAFLKRNTRQDGDGQYMHLVGLGFTAFIPSIFSNNAHNEAVALVDRHLTPCTEPEGVNENWNKAYCYAYSALTPYIGNTQRPSVRDWISTQPASKQRELLRAAAGGEFLFPKRTDHAISFFIKSEVAIPSAAGTVNGKPRGIQANKSPAVGIVLGPHCHMVKTSMMQPTLNCGRDTTWPRFFFTCGATVARIGDYVHHHLTHGWIILECDFSVFDSTQREAAMKTEFLVNQRFGLSDAEAHAYMQQWDLMGYGKFHSYGSRGGRPSGGYNTSNGSSLITAIATYYALTRVQQLTELRFDWRAAVLGDDSMTPIRLSDQSAPWCFDDFKLAFESAMSELGLTAKLAWNGQFPTYCSSMFVPVIRDGAPTHLMVPDVRRVLAKMGYSDKPMRPARALVYVRDNLRGLPSLGLLPIGRHLMKAYGLTEMDDFQGLEDSDYLMHRTFKFNVTPHPDTDSSYCQQIGMSEESAHILGGVIYSAVRMSYRRPAMLSHPILDELSIGWLGEPLLDASHSHYPQHYKPPPLKLGKGGRIEAMSSNLASSSAVEAAASVTCTQTQSCHNDQNLSSFPKLHAESTPAAHDPVLGLAAPKCLENRAKVEGPSPSTSESPGRSPPDSAPAMLMPTIPLSRRVRRILQHRHRLHALHQTMSSSVPSSLSGTHNLALPVSGYAAANRSVFAPQLQAMDSPQNLIRSSDAGRSLLPCGHHGRRVPRFHTELLSTYPPQIWGLVDHLQLAQRSITNTGSCLPTSSTLLPVQHCSLDRAECVSLMMPNPTSRICSPHSMRSEPTHRSSRSPTGSQKHNSAGDHKTQPSTTSTTSRRSRTRTHRSQIQRKRAQPARQSLRASTVAFSTRSLTQSPPRSDTSTSNSRSNSMRRGRPPSPPPPSMNRSGKQYGHSSTTCVDGCPDHPALSESYYLRAMFSPIAPHLDHQQLQHQRLMRDESIPFIRYAHPTCTQ